MAKPGQTTYMGSWYDKHRAGLTEQEKAEITRWRKSTFAPNKGVKQLFVLRDWLADRSKPMPDLLFFYGNYGRLELYGHYFIRHRNGQPPITISLAEQQAWRKEAYAYAFTTEQISEVLIFNANGFFKGIVEAGEDLIYQLTKQQLEQGLSKLDELLSGDLAQKYTPTQYTAEDVKNGDDDDPYEYNLYREPLELRSLLEGTMAAIPFLTYLMRMPNPLRPDFGMPRAALADKLEALVGDETRQRLNELDDRLRQLLEFWYKHKHSSGAKYYHSFDYAPELPEFWWYHWNDERRKQN